MISPMAPESLQRVGRELATTLGEAGQAFEKYVESRRNTELLERFIERLHTAQGVMRLVEFYGGALLAEEMEQVARQHLENPQQRADERLDVLTCSMVQLPEYIERVLAGGRDVPLALLPLLNDLRAVRNSPLLTENTLFLLNLSSSHQEAAVEEPVAEAPGTRDTAHDIRKRFLAHLLKYLTTGKTSSVRRMISDAGRLRELARGSLFSDVWWAVAGTLEAVAGQGLEASVALKSLYGRADQQTRRLIAEGLETFEADPPRELLNNLLYYVARASSDGEQVRSLKEHFSLDVLLPADMDLEAQRKGLGGPSPSLMKTVCGAIRDDLNTVKDGLDIFVRTGHGRTEELQPHVEMLGKISDTLNVLGLGRVADEIRGETEKLADIVAGNKTADEDLLMQIASTVLKVETRLEERLLELASPLRVEQVQAEEEVAEEADDSGEFKAVVAAVMRESLTNLAHIKESVVQFFAHENRSRSLEHVRRLLKEINSAMLMLGNTRVGEVLYKVVDKLEGWEKSATDELRAWQIDRLADAIVSVEYYMETLEAGRTDPAYMLGNAEQSLESLSDELVTEPVVVDISEPGATTVLHETGEHDIRPEDTIVRTVLMARPDFQKGEPVPPVFASEDRVDTEFLELFIEEAKEEIENLAEHFPRWRDHPADHDALDTVRRSFHTLKGSGRMVGAQLIGEFAWSIENLLNRLLHRTLQRTEEMIYLLETALTALPELVEQLEVGTRPVADIEGLIRQAWALSETEVLGDDSVDLSPDELQKTAVVPRFEDVEPTEVIEAIFADPTSKIEVIPTEKVEALDIELSGETGVAGEFEGEAEESDDAAILPILDLDSGEIEVIDETGILTELTEDKTGMRPAIVVETDTDSGLTEPTADKTGMYPALDIDTQGPDTADADDTEAAIELQELEDDGSTAITLSMEPALYEIFTAETVGHLETLRNFVVDCEQKQPPYTVTEELYRACHTLHGSAEMAGIKQIADLAGPLDDFINDVYRGGRLPEPALGILTDTASAIQEIVDKINLPGPYESDHGALNARIRSLEVVEPAVPDEGLEVGEFMVEEHDEDVADTVVTEAVEVLPEEEQPEPAESALVEEVDEFDAEIAAIFAVEASELLDAADKALANWRSAPSIPEYATALQRHLHTLKGGARMAGIMTMGDFSHELETLVKQTGSGQIETSTEVFDTLQAALDELARMRDQMAEGRKIDDIEPLSKRVAALYKPESEVEAEEPETAAPEPSVELEEPKTVVPLRPFPEPPRPAVDERDEIARVSAELLQRLLNNAGEISIFRARLEQSMRAFGFNLNELSTTTARLTEQLRNLEIETEKQILHRYFEEGGRTGDFDPLEMDRYSSIQQFSRALAESASDLNSIRELLEELTSESETLLLQQGRVTTELQDGLMRTRMVPFRQHAPRLSRIVRQTAADAGKRAELHLTGADGEMDRQMLERMLQPLEHMLRNAVIHGIESPDVRHSRDKPEVGNVYIKLHREASDLVIEVSDDGRGLDIKALTEKAREAGAIKPNQELDDHAAMLLVFEPGLTTATELTQTAGRGVGMDVVANEVKQLGGVIDIESVRNQGTTIQIRVPFTLAVAQSLLVGVGGEVYALPMPTIEGVARVACGELEQALSTEHPVFEYGGHTYELGFLSSLVRLPTTRLNEETVTVPVVLVRTGEQSAALIADHLVGAREVVVKSVGPQISAIRGVSGATILGDGSTALILDLGALVRAGAQGLIPARADEAEKDQRTFVLVVDDSITVRRVTQRLLERNGMRVMTAKDGVDAVSILQENVPDIMLLDIEMPRMDGYEVAQHVRGDDRLKGIPIVIITSRVGLKHRARAIELGVDDYLGKPYQESELLAAIEPLARKARRRA